MSLSWRSLFSLSSLSSLLMTLYIGAAVFNLYKLMHPLAFVDTSMYNPDTHYVHPLWKQGQALHMRVYLSTHSKFRLDFLKAKSTTTTTTETKVEEASSSETQNQQDQHVIDDVALLWDETIDSPAFSKSFLLTTTPQDQEKDDPSFQFASSWLDDAERTALEQGEGGAMAVLTGAGQGIESTSLLLTAYQSASNHAQHVLKMVTALLSGSSVSADSDASNETNDSINRWGRTTVSLSPSSSIWSAIQSNSTLYIHVMVLRADIDATKHWPPTDTTEAESMFVGASRANALLSGNVDLIKFDAPSHIGKPGRILYHDLVYLWKQYVVRSVGPDQRPPWDMEYSKPNEYELYQRALSMKAMGVGYPYWKPEVAVKFVSDVVSYPTDFVMRSGMPLVQIKPSREHPTGYSFTPAIHVDEIGMTSEKYIPMNETVTSLPLRISFDRSDMPHQQHMRSSATAGGISPARWRLLTHLSEALESQKQLGFDDSDIDEIRRLIADTNVTLLTITLLASALHLLFEFLTFKNEVSFWQKNDDLTGLSVRSLFLDMMGQTVILLYLIERDSSLLVTVPSGIGCLIALWKCRRAAGLKFVRADVNSKGSWWNAVPRLLGYELRATRLEIKTNKGGDGSAKDKLAALTIDSDRIATRTLGTFLLPLVLGYTLYSFVRQEHSGWYSWLVTSASSAVYALGFVLMTPQLFLNWKLKSVAHLPWRVLVYKSLNTFIDDLFSFVIRMPTMARISCFRDDVVFFIYLYQRWLYPVDVSRPVEGGGGAPAESRGDVDRKTKTE